ncbi:MAG: DUF2064 domain-containing protein [Balneolaceae bacterium]
MRKLSEHTGVSLPTNHSDTVILFFTRSEEEDAVLKNVLPQRNLAKQTFLHLINHTQNEAVKSGIPVYTIRSDKQVGESFGQKLGNAFCLLYEKGFEKVIAIGNDCPELDAEALKNAELRLSESDVVLGPSRDGGTYLIGIHKKAFLKKEFENINWQTPDVFQELQSIFTVRGLHPEYLPVLSDIDTDRDLTFILQKKSLKKHLIKLLSSLKSLFASWFSKYAHYFIPCSGTIHIDRLYQRGPPS